MILDKTNIERSINIFNRLSYEKKLRNIISVMDSGEALDDEFLDIFIDIIKQFRTEIKAFRIINEKANNNNGVVLEGDELITEIIKHPLVIANNRNTLIDNLLK